jgi:hypothetical protein
VVAPNLKPAQARRLRLTAQHLTDAAPGESLRDAAAVCGVQDAPPGSAALALAARVPTASRADVTAAIATDRSLVVVWSRRGSPYLVPSEDLGVFTLGLLPDDAESWRLAVQGFAKQIDSAGTCAEELVGEVDRALREVLDGRELTKRELGEALAPFMPAALQNWFEADTFSSFTAILARAASAYGGFVLGPRHGAEASFVRTDQWLGAYPEDDVDELRVEMARRYVRGYGPTRASAFAEWAGIGPEQARRTWAKLQPELVRVRVEGADAWCPAEWEPWIADPPVAEGLRLLPPHDPYLASVDRLVIAPERSRHAALWKAAGSPGAVLYNDEIVGVWRAQVDRRRLRVRITPFRTLPKSAAPGIKAAAKRMAQFRGLPDAVVETRS